MGLDGMNSHSQQSEAIAGLILLFSVPFLIRLAWKGAEKSAHKIEEYIIETFPQLGDSSYLISIIVSAVCFYGLLAFALFNVWRDLGDLVWLSRWISRTIIG
jgi:hypothetical protein